MRAFGCFLLGVVAAVLVIVFGLFAVENGQVTQFSFLGNTMRMSLWLLVGIPAIIGFLLALLLVTPARSGFDRQTAMMREQHRSLERELANQRRQNDQLRDDNNRWQTQYQQLVTERDGLHARLNAIQQAAARPAQETVAEREPAPYASAPTGRQREDAVRTEDSARPIEYDRAPAERRAVREETPAQRGVVEPTEDAQAAEPTQPAQPTLGERLRGVFGAPRPADEEEADRLDSRGPAPTM